MVKCKPIINSPSALELRIAAAVADPSTVLVKNEVLDESPNVCIKREEESFDVKPSVTINGPVKRAGSKMRPTPIFTQNKIIKAESCKRVIQERTEVQQQRRSVRQLTASTQKNVPTPVSPAPKKRGRPSKSCNNNNRFGSALVPVLAKRAAAKPLSPINSYRPVNSRSATGHATRNGGRQGQNTTKKAVNRRFTPAASVIVGRASKAPKKQTPKKPAPKATKKRVVKKEVADNSDDDNEDFASYTVNTITAHGFIPSMHVIEYFVKWEGFGPKHDTFEPEGSFISFVKVRAYWASVQKKLNKAKASKAKDKLAQIEAAHIVRGAFVKHELQAENLRFVTSSDNKFVKILISKILIEQFGWDYMVSSFKAFGAVQSYAKLLNIYLEQLEELSKYIALYPTIEVINDVDHALPMPLHLIVFHNGDHKDRLRLVADEETKRENLCLLTEKEMDEIARHMSMYEATNDRHAFIEPYANGCEGKQARHLTKVDGEDADPPCLQRVALVLHRHPDLFWELRTLHRIETGTPIMYMCGQYASQAVAEHSLREESEMVAFRMFLKLPFGMCLDRRRYSDLTRYISHSCNPNCIVRLEYPGGVNYLGAVPVLVVVAAEPIIADEALTIDFLKMFPDVSVDGLPVDPSLPKRPRNTDPSKADSHVAEHIKLVDADIDHLICLCNDQNCMTIKWKEDQPAPTRNRAKDDRLSTMIMSSFGGLEVYEEDEV